PFFTNEQADENINDANSNIDAQTAPAWVIDPDSSHAEFTATVQGSPFPGPFTGMTGSIAFDPDTLPGSHARVAVRIATAASGSTDRDEALILPVWLAAESFPESVFESTAFTRLGPESYIVRGRLTIRDITLPVEMPFTLTIAPDPAGNN